MTGSAIKRLLLFGEVLSLMGCVVKDDSGSPFIRPRREIRMIRRKTLESLLMTRLACDVIDCR
jgi:hypothetical protein